MPEGSNPKRPDSVAGQNGPIDLTPSQLKNLFAVASGAFDTQPSPHGRLEWEPLDVESLRGRFPQYEITGFVARGGMGAVYRGVQRALNREVAIKILPPEMHGDSMCGFEFAARFNREGEALARLNHPNIVAVYDAGEVTLPGGVVAYFVMEFVEGSDLAQVIRDEAPLAAERTVRILAAVCDALAFAHEEGILHRDIKPSNIIIDRKGRVKVADFGLAKAIGHESQMLTRTNQAEGTPDYLAPEAMITDAHLDQRADIYSLGVMLYQMLTGSIPRGRFEAPSRVVPCLDRRFDSIVDKAMQSDPEKRYRRATEMKAALEAIAPVGSNRKEAVAVGRKWPRIRFLVITVVSCLVMMVAFLLMNPLGRNSPNRIGPTIIGRKDDDATQGIDGLRSIPIQVPEAPKKTTVLRKWIDATEFVKSEGLKSGGLEVDGEWLEPTRQSVWLTMEAAPMPADLAIRVRFACRVELNMRKSDGPVGGYYSLGVGGPFQYISKTVGGVRTDIATPKRLGPESINGSEHELIATTHGNCVHLVLDGRSVITTEDAAFVNGSAMLALYDDGPGKMARVRKIEWMDLRGLNEADAMEAAGVNRLLAEHSGARIQFPYGIWAPLHDQEKDAREVASNPKHQTDGPWMLLADVSYGWYEHEIVPMTNVGIRAMFRGRRVKENQFPQMNLRGLPGRQHAVNLHIHGGRLQIRTTQAGYPLLAEARLFDPLVPEKEYSVEFYAIGNLLLARVNGQTLTAENPMSARPGMVSIYGANMDWFKAVQVMNLDGIDEKSAKAIIGFEGE